MNTETPTETKIGRPLYDAAADRSDQVADFLDQARTFASTGLKPGSGFVAARAELAAGLRAIADQIDPQ